MLLRNRELRRDALLYLVLTVTACAVGFWENTACGVLTLAACVVFTAAHFVCTRSRYQRLKKLSDDLDALLHSGAPLAIEAYNEGELSILSNQIQKMILRLKEAAEASHADKLRLADSLADISHQLRTPLTAMNLTAAMLAEPQLSDDRRYELTVELKNLLSRTQWLVESLLKLSKLDAGTVKLSKHAVSVDALIAKAAVPLTIPMELREQRLVLNIAPCTLQADLTWTAEALGNILKNCMEHTPAGGTITVTASDNALYTQITVEDTGPGFAAEDIHHLFERFYKGKNASESSYGIGLALARTIITAQNGTIQAGNVPCGACFTVKFYKQTI